MSLGGGAYTTLDTAVTQLDQPPASPTRSPPATQRERVQLLAGPHRGRDHRRRHHQHRRARVLLQLRHLPGHLRAGPEHHLGLVHQRHRDQHDQRHLDGVAARGRRRRALPGGQPDRHAPPRCATRWSPRPPPTWSTNPGTGSPNRLLYTGSGGTPPPPPPGTTFTNGTDVSIPDYPGAAVTSSITVTGLTGNASAATPVAVDIRHTYRGDLVIDLIAPDGSATG